MEGTLNLVGFGLAAIGPGIATGLIFAAHRDCFTRASHTFIAHDPCALDAWLPRSNLPCSSLLLLIQKAYEYPIPIDDRIAGQLPFA